jgi:hypothetical protein
MLLEQTKPDTDQRLLGQLRFTISEVDDDTTFPVTLSELSTDKSFADLSDSASPIVLGDPIAAGTARHYRITVTIPNQVPLEGDPAGWISKDANHALFGKSACLLAHFTGEAVVVP